MDWIVLVQQIGLALVGILGSAVVAFGAIFVQRLAKRYGFHLDSEEQQRIAGALRTGIVNAERWVRNKTGDKPSGSEKMDYAIKVAKTMLSSKLVKKFTEEQMKILAEAILEVEKYSNKPKPPGAK